VQKAEIAEDFRRVFEAFSTVEELLNPSREDDEDMPDAGPVKVEEVQFP
jgi:hypothetical protein